MRRRTAIRSALAVASALLCASLLGAPRLFAQDAPPEKSDADAKQDKARGDALVRVRGLADRIERMRDPDVKIRALAQLADITCKYDKTAAELIFHRAHRAFEAAQRDAQGTRQSEAPIDYESIGHEVFQEMLRCQPALAIRLMPPRDDDSGEEQAISAATDLNAANDLLQQDAAKAVALASHTLNVPLNRARATALMQFLESLHPANAALADQLFLQILEALRRQPSVDAGCLPVVGNYLFDFATIMLTEVGPGGTVTTSVMTGGVATNRAWTTAELARPYLETALNILSRPVSEWQRQQIEIGSLTHLIAKSQEFAPDLTASFQLVIERLRGALAAAHAALTAELATEDLRADTGDSLSAELHKTTDPDQRDFLLCRLAVRHLHQHQPEQARDYIVQIKKAELRDELTRLADFTEAAGGLEGRDVDAAVAALNRLPAGAYRALVNLGYAVLNFQGKGRGNQNSARASLNLGERDLEKAPFRVKARLLAAATAISGLHDDDPVLGPQNTLVLLRRAVTAFNDVRRDEQRDRGEERSPVPGRESKGSDNQPSADFELMADAGGIHQLISFGNSNFGFRLSVESVDIFDLSELVVYQRLRRSAPAAENILSLLEDDSLLAPALAALAVAYLEEGFRKPAAPAPVRAEK